MRVDNAEESRRGWRRFVDVRPGEGALIAWASLYVFSLMTAYYVLRPLRDAFGVESGIENLSWLFFATLVAMIALNPLYAALVRRLVARRVVTVVYLFFLATLTGFGLASHLVDSQGIVWVGRAFFVWLSVFNLFVVSIFWTLMVDIFDSGGAKRLFGFLSAAATLGATLGSTIAATLAKVLSPDLLMACAGALLLVAIVCVTRIVHLARGVPSRSHPDLEREAIGGGLLAGLAHVARSPYLLNIGVYILLFAVTSTFLYFQQAEIAKSSFADRAARTAFFAQVDLAVNLLTLAIQLFLTGRMLKHLGTPVCAALLPAMTFVGFAILAWSPTIGALVLFQIARRVGNFALAKPTREVLFTVVTREDKYKAKNVVDTVVYRLGDQVGAWSYALLGGLGIVGLSLAALPIAAVWLGVGWWLGTRQEAMARKLPDDAKDDAPEVDVALAPR